MTTDDAAREAVVVRLEDAARLQKLAALGQLTLGVAHDFNNALSIIDLNVAALLGQPRPSSDREALEDVRDAVARARSLARDLMSMGEARRNEYQPLELDTLLERATCMMHKVLGPHIEVKTSLEANARAMGDAGLLEQVLLNLLLNARDAMPAGGSITVSTRRVGDVVRVSVRDTGGGIPRTLRERIFEPFFTTKAADKGSGLGLAMVRRIIEQHGGRVEVDSVLGEGSVFHLELPMVR